MPDLEQSLEKAYRLRDIITKEVSLVDRGANKWKFLVVKRDGTTEEDSDAEGVEVEFDEGEGNLVKSEHEEGESATYKQAMLDCCMTCLSHLMSAGEMAKAGECGTMDYYKSVVSALKAVYEKMDMPEEKMDMPEEKMEMDHGEQVEAISEAIEALMQVAEELNDMSSSDPDPAVKSAMEDKLSAVKDYIVKVMVNSGYQTLSEKSDGAEHPAKDVEEEEEAVEKAADTSVDPSEAADTSLVGDALGEIILELKASNKSQEELKKRGQKMSAARVKRFRKALDDLLKILNEVSANVDAAAERTEKVEDEPTPVQDLFVEKDAKPDREQEETNNSLKEKLNKLEKQLEEKELEINTLKTVVSPSQSLAIEKENDKKEKRFYWPMDMNGSK